ncbi:MAG: dTMP kinase [Gemmatimonadota bacterium]
MSALFLAIEGVEGAGKTTLARWLGARLHEWGVPCRVEREPGGTPVGERAREILLDPGLEVSPEAELLLYLAARAEFVRAVVRPALEAGEVVIADRYELSTFAYQGIARGLGLERVRRLNAFATGGLSPHSTLLLEIDPERGFDRKSRGLAQIDALDRLEREGAAFLAAVAEAYARLAAADERVIRIPADHPIEAVREAAIGALARAFPETFARAAGLRH